MAKTQQYLALYTGPSGPISAEFTARAFHCWPTAGNPVVEHIGRHGGDWFDSASDALDLVLNADECDIELALIAGGWSLLHDAEDSGKFAVYYRV